MQPYYGQKPESKLPEKTVHQKHKTKADRTSTKKQKKEPSPFHPQGPLWVYELGARSSS